MSKYGFWVEHPEHAPRGEHSPIPLTEADKLNGWSQVELRSCLDFSTSQPATPQGGAYAELPDPSPDQLRAIARTARNSSGSASDDCGPLAYVLHGWRAAAIAFRAQQAALVEAHQHARIAELEAQLEAAGFTAADMATASAQGFRDGVASFAASAGSEPEAPSGWREAIGEIRAGLEDSEPSGYDNSGYRSFAGTVLDAVEDGLLKLAAPQPSPTPQADSQPAVQQRDATRAAARALSDRFAEMCNVDKEDHWQDHSDDVLSDAELVVSTYLAALATADSQPAPSDEAILSAARNWGEVQQYNRTDGKGIEYRIVFNVHRRAAHFASELLAPQPSPTAQAADSVLEDADRIVKWSDRVQRAHPKSEPEFWPDALRVKYMADEISDLRAALAKADSVLEDAGGANWQDISTAPKDGTRFVAVGQNYGLDSETQHTCIAQRLAGCWVEVSDWNGASKLKYLTHWMPLPPLPGSAARAPADSVTAPAAGNWIDADDVNRLVRELDVCLNGEAGAAAQASLCDVVAQVRHEAAKRGQPLLAAPAGR